MARCESCMTNPVHPDKKCCFNCARVNTNCEVWHNCGEDCPGWDSKVITNADRIRAMSDEELALVVRAIIYAEDCPAIGCDCNKCFFKEPCSNGSKWHGKETEWLKKPAEVV